MDTQGVMHRQLPGTFRNVQALRGLAAVMVVLFHASEKWSMAAVGTFSLAWMGGVCGVDIFFVISGFVMAMSSLNSSSKGPKTALQFLERRIVRIMPLYWLISIALLLRIDLGLVHGPLITRPVPLRDMFCSFLLIPYWHGGETSPLLGQGWTLSYEMFFYLLLAAALWFRRSVPLVLTLSLALLVLIGVFRTEQWPAVTVLFRPILLEFLAGFWLGIAVKSRRSVGPWTAALTGAAALVTVTFLHLSNGIAQQLEFGIGAVLIVQAAIALEATMGAKIPRWSLLIGDASYSIYLAHPMLLELYAKILRRANVLVPGRIRLQDELITVLFCLGLSVLVGLIVYFLLESPMNRGLQHLLRLKRPVQTRSAAEVIPA